MTGARAAEPPGRVGHRMTEVVVWLPGWGACGHCLHPANESSCLHWRLRTTRYMYAQHDTDE